MTRVRLLVAYDGTDFRGFAANPGVVTVGGTLRDAVERVIGSAVTVTAAGRTDAGVHARGQVVTFDGPDGIDLDRLRRSVNGLCAPSIVVRQAEIAPAGFDARFSAEWRRYCYTVLNTEVPDPFLARTAWHVPQPLDVAVMRLACDPIIGEHDFSSFCRAPKVGEGEPPATLVRRVIEATWRPVGACVVFEIRARSFCHQMVRALVGFMVDTGRDRRRAGDMRAALHARDRAATADIAPPHGLCLWDVGYADGFGR
jgi:tRNA pseudouridine38-40 synthase